MEKLRRAKAALKEYEVLHAELLQRNNMFLQVAAACIGALVAIIGFWAAGNLAGPWAIALAVIVIVLGLAVWRTIDIGARNANRRINEIEASLSEHLGDESLAEPRSGPRFKRPDAR